MSIKLCSPTKGMGPKRICKEFPNKNWAVSSVEDLLRKIDKTNLISWKVGSERNWTVRTTQNIECVAELIYSQEGNPGSSKIPRDIQKGTLNSCLLDCLVLWSFRCFTWTYTQARISVYVSPLWYNTVGVLWFYRIIFNNILTYSLGFDINMCKTIEQIIWCVILSI